MQKSESFFIEDKINIGYKNKSATILGQLSHISFLRNKMLVGVWTLLFIHIFLLRMRIQWITLTYVDSLTCYFKVYVQICGTSNMVWRIIFDGE